MVASPELAAVFVADMPEEALSEILPRPSCEDTDMASTPPTAASTPEKNLAAPDVSNDEAVTSYARAKLAYLLDPCKAPAGTEPLCKMQRMESPSERGNSTLSPVTQLLGEGACDKVEEPDCVSTEAQDLAGLRKENERLRAELEQRPLAVLGIKSGKCGGCGAPKTVEGRAFVELGKLYCERCWSQWETCGWWKPAMRVSTTPPTVGTSGLPEFSAEDAFSIPAFACAHDDLSLLDRLRSELPEGKDFSDWHGARHLGMHFQGDDVSALRLASAPPALREMVLKLEKAFGIEASATRLNLYRSSADYKPFHFDRGRDENGVPQVTVGLSLGATRELSFTHWKTGLTMSYPQRNGDVFAFTPELNNVFMHGVPRIGDARQQDQQDGPRVSLILWGSHLALRKPPAAAQCEEVNAVAAVVSR